MKLKKWNGSAWVQEYPETNVSNIVATGTPSSSTFLRGDGQWVVPGGGERKSYSSISGTSGAWYDLFTVADGTNGALFVSIQTYAHDDLLFAVGTGYGSSDVATITILNCVYNPSGPYASITGVRVTSTGLVQAQFTWSSGPTVDIDVAVYGSGTLPTLSASLTANATSYTIQDTVSITGLQGKIRSENGFVQGSTPIPSGTGTLNELTYWSGANTIGTLTTGTYPSLTELSYIKGLSSAVQTQLNNKAATSHTHSIGYYNSAITSDLDTLFSTGEFGFANTTTGRPEDYGQGINIVNTGTAYNGTSNWITQLAFGTTGSTSYFRTKVNTGAWTAWRKLWNDANDGTGSGLDADLLDGQHGSYFLDTSGSTQTKSGSLNISGSSTITGSISAGRYNQSANGSPTSNLGTPSVSEIALFDEQFDNKTAFANIARISAQTSTDGVTWTEYTLTDAQKRGLVGGDAGTNITITYNTTYFRIKLLPGGYVYANALYGYFTTTYHTTAIQIYKKHDSGSYTQHTSSTNQVSGWPGHFYLPFSTIPWLDAGTLGTHFDDIYIVFIPTWNTSYSGSNITLHKLQIWGGYPASKRNIYSTDDSQNVAFPGTLSGTRLISTIATGTAPLSVTSTTAVTNLNADLLDGFHAAGLSKRVSLTGQVQTTEYRKSVIALCELTNTNPSANSYSIGMLTFHRTNGLYAPVLIQIAMEKLYNVVGANYTSFVQSGDSFGDNIQYIKFQYNGVWYGGIEFFFSDAGLSEVTFHGESNFAIFGVDYFNTQNSTVINAEINSSITVANMTAENDLFINNNKVWNAQNDGAASGLDADLLDGNQASAFLLTTARNAANGVAPLDATSKVPVANLPDFITGAGRGFYLVGTISGAVSLSAASTGLVAQLVALSGGDYENMYGYMWTAAAEVTLTWTDQTTLGPVYQYHVLTPGDEGDSTSPVTLEAGDMIVFTKYSDTAGNGDDQEFTFSVINSSDPRFANYVPLTGGNITGNLNVSGSVGIGTTAPDSIFEIKAATPIMTINGTTNNSFRGVNFKASGTTFASLLHNSSTGETTLTSGKSGDTGYFLTFDTLGAERMRITDTGNVGIGTTSPSNLFTLSGALVNLGILNTTPGTTATPSFNGIRFYGFAENQNGWVASVDGGNIQSDGYSGFLRFSTKPNTINTNPVERMRINEVGNVGIGTASPGAKLHIFDANPMLIIQDSETTSASTDSRIRLAESGASNVVNEYVDLRKNGDDFQIDIYNGSTTITPFVVKYAGNVGIGTTAPAVKLHVAGGTRIVGQLNVMGDAETKRVWIDYDDTLDLASIQAIQDGVDYKNIALQAQGGRIGVGTSTNLDEVLTVNGTMASPISLARSGGTDANNSVRYKMATESWYAGVSSNKEYAIRFNNADLANSPSLSIETNGQVGVNTNNPGGQLQVNSGSTTRVPLIVDTLASHTADLQQWKLNNANISRVDSSGYFAGVGIYHITSANNALIVTDSSGTTIRRNVADTNPALIVNLANASATGNIQVWQKAGTALASVANNGDISALRFTSTQATGTAPLTVASTTVVTNLNADLLDGNHAAAFALASHTHAIADVTSLQTSLDAKAPLASPTLTGTPAAPTATAGTNTTQIATTAFVSTAVTNLINAAPGALDTLDELAAALGDDASFATTVTNSIASKANDADVVKLTGTQSVGGVKTFTSIPIFDAGATIANNTGTISDSITFNTAQAFTGPYLRGSVQVLQRGYYTSQYQIWDAESVPNPTSGTGTSNQIAYYTGTQTLGSLSTATYPSLTELSYVKGVTSAIQTQLNREVTKYKATITSSVSGVTTRTTVTSITLLANKYYHLDVTGMYSKTSTSGTTAPVINIAVDNATGTPTINGRFEWLNGSAATAYTVSNTNGAITTSDSARGFTAATATASAITTTPWGLKALFYTGTSDKILTFYISSSSTVSGTCAVENISIHATEVLA